jgi:outer membrane cobalamin receptor
MKNSAAAVVLMLSLMVSPGAVTAEEATIQLEEVVVTATKTEKDPKDVTQSVTVISADEIKKSAATNAAEVLRKAAGLSVNDQGPRGGLETVSIRGAEYSQVLVLLDGKRLNSPRDAGYDLSALPVSLDDIERIEIVRGPSSALYGADAVGGVVNIITKKPDQSQTKISGSAGSHGYDLLSASNAGKMSGFYYLLSAARETSEGYRPNSDLSQGTAGGKIGYEIGDRSSIELTGNYIGKENGVPGPTNMPSLLARQWDRQTVAGLGYKVRFSKELDLKMNAYYNREVLKYKDPDFLVDSRHESSTKGGEIQVNWLANSWNAITAGFEAKWDRLNSTDSGEHATSLVAGYLQDEISVGEPLILILGGRIDSHSVYGDQFSPRVSARYLFSNTGTIIRASAGKSFRAPTFNDLYWLDPWSTGNPNLKPETAKEYELGIEQPLGKGNVIKLAGFERKVKDLIVWRYDVFPMHPENIGRARVRGGEAESRFQISEPLVWAINYTYLQIVDELTGMRIYDRPQHQFKSYLNLALPTKTNLYLEGRMAKYYVKPGADAWEYSVLDGKVTQSVPLGKGVQGELFFSMKNIFDRKYALARSYDFLTGGHAGDYPMPPREIFGGLSLLF